MSLSKRHYSDSSIRSNLHVVDTPPSPAEVNLTRKQLASEIKLQQSSHELLLLYQESQNWVAVSEVAQTLNTNSKRIEQLKGQLLSLENGSIVSHPPLLESILEAESPADNQHVAVTEQRAADSSPVETVTEREDQSQDNTEDIDKGTVEENKEFKKKASRSGSCTESDREDNQGEGGEIISLNHTDPEYTSKPLEPKENSLEPPSEEEEDIKEQAINKEEVHVDQHIDAQSSTVDSPPPQENKAESVPEETVSEGSHTEEPNTQLTCTDKPASENTQQPPTEEFIPQPVQPVSGDKQFSPLVEQDLQPVAVTEQPALDCPPDTLDQPPPVDISSQPATSEGTPEPQITKEDFEAAVTDTLQVVDQPLPEQSNVDGTDPEEQPDRSATVTPERPVLVDSLDQSELLDEPIIGEDTVEESLEKLAALVGNIQLDLEESLEEVEVDVNREEEKSEDNVALPKQDAKETVPVSSLSRESSVEFEDAFNDEQVRVESSDETSDSFFSPPESLSPSDNIPPHIEASVEESEPADRESVEDQPQPEGETTDKIKVVEEEEAPELSDPNQLSSPLEIVSEAPIKKEEAPELSDPNQSSPLEAVPEVPTKKEEDPVIINCDQPLYGDTADTVSPSIDSQPSSKNKEDPLIVPVQDPSIDKQEEDPNNQAPDSLPAVEHPVASAPTEEKDTTGPVSEETTPVISDIVSPSVNAQAKNEENPLIIPVQDPAVDKQEKDPTDQAPDSIPAAEDPEISALTAENGTSVSEEPTPVITDTALSSVDSQPDPKYEENPVIVPVQDTVIDKQEEDPIDQLPNDLPAIEDTVASATAENSTTASDSEEETPAITTANQNTPATVQDTEQEGDTGNLVLTTTDDTPAPVITVESTETSATSVETKEEVPGNQETDDSGDSTNTDSIVATPKPFESEDTPTILSNQVSNQPEEPPAALDRSTPPSKSEQTPEITSQNEDSSPKKRKMGDITFTVNKFRNPSDNKMFFRIDIRSFDQIFSDPDLLQHLPVLHSLEDFLRLRKRLESIAKERDSEAEIPELIPESNHVDTSMKNGNGVDEECEQFERFLNQVVNDPKLGKEKVVVQFLSGRGPSLSPGPTESQTEAPGLLTNGVTEPSSEPPTLSPMDSQPDKDMDGEAPVVKTDNGSTLLDRDELTFSPNHSDRTSSTASNAATDESAPELGEVTSKSQENLQLPRSESNPVLGDFEHSLDSANTIHQSLVPSQIKYASSDDILQNSVMGISDESRVKPRYDAKRSTMKDKLRKQGKRIMRKTGGNKKRSQTLRDQPPDVTMSRPISSQEWDPTCLLEELYSDYKQGTTQTSVSGESARHFGYLEKLPTGQSKPSMLKGWKRRYFRAQEGNIYYYEGRTQDKALGFVRLSTAKIILIPEKNQIQIVEKGSKNSIMLKAPDSEELLAWHRALELEAVHPTQPAPLSPVLKVDNPVLIVDIGACSVRAGISREDAYPEVFFPAVCSLDASTLGILDCGYNALLPQNRYGAHQIYPRKTSLRMDKHDTSLKIKAMEGIMTNILERLDVDPQSTQLLLTHPPTVPEKYRNELADLLLSDFMFDSVCFQEQAVLALYSYNTTSGIVVDIGDHIDVVPFIDGYKIDAGISRMAFGGNAVIENLSKLITSKGIRYFSETEVYINRMIMESLCYVSEDYNQAAANCEANAVEFTRAIDVDRFQLPDHRKVIALDLALFKAPEGLFRPNLWGKDVPPLPELVWKAIQACPIDQRREMAKKIYLSGATTLLPGLQERLQKEVAALSPSGLTVEVHASPTRHHAAYLGASVLAGLSSFQSYLVTQEEWTAAGVEALRKWGGT